MGTGFNAKGEPCGHCQGSDPNRDIENCNCSGEPPGTASAAGNIARDGQLKTQHQGSIVETLRSKLSVISMVTGMFGRAKQKLARLPLRWL